MIVNARFLGLRTGKLYTLGAIFEPVLRPRLRFCPAFGPEFVLPQKLVA
jgi:hypothetical protein